MEAFGNLRQDMLQEIMSWLPPETIAQCKCVCKSWCALIDTLIKNSAFVAKHLRNMISNKVSSSPFFLLRYDTSEDLPEFLSAPVTCLLSVSRDTDIDTDQVPCEIRDVDLLEGRNLFVDFLSHCDGVTCLVDRCRDRVVLSNLTIWEFKFVPSLHLIHGSELLGVGLGCDSETSDYKVVMIKSAIQEDSPYRAKVYTLSTNSWRNVAMPREIEYFPSDNQEVYCNGVCYWYYEVRDREGMISFDVHDEVFCKVPLPDTPQSTQAGYYKTLAESKGSVALFHYPQESPMLIDMWVMDGLGGVVGSCCWTKRRTIGPIAGVEFPVAFWRDDELLLESGDRKIVSYNLRNQKLRRLPVESVISRSAHFVPCVKSFVSVL